ncbi:hypothetical protein M5362_13045 [Streptomyces sp. Je 1-79]|uniref:hypothetical protein n=1 Tax=Streptomyces sp. Je 1-79 TaxID=2943847 RepID=UPI0021A42655|nr:hypothetical protein [Streptomyces sp. Je 1-79]MCT4354057.1 hypothetical protein [Streptomyces sp. Je 1-79]
MIGAAVFAGAFAVAFVAFGLFVDARGLWWRFRAPRLADPEAHEPSAASFTARRAVMVVLGLFLAYESFSMLKLAGVFDSGPDHAEILERVQDVARDLETEDGAGRYRLTGLEGSWGDFINPALKGPEAWDPVATLVEDEEETSGGGTSGAETSGSGTSGAGTSGAGTSGSGSSGADKGSTSDIKGPFVERYEIDGSVCLTVTATPLPGQSARDHALDLVMYGIRTEVVDEACPEAA